MDQVTWERAWAAHRMFLTADGETGKPGGNETIRVTSDSLLQLKVPVPLVPTLGTQLVLTVPVAFCHRGDEWETRVGARQAVRYDITFNSASGRWYLDASWSTPAPAAAPMDLLRNGKVVGVDLNADHLAVAVLDPAGNPIGHPTSIPLELKGLPASTRDGRLRAAISDLIHHAHTAGADAIAVENLNFDDARTTGRERMGRGKKGKTFRRIVAGIPTGKFRDRLVAMAYHAGLAVIAVDPAYTSQWGAQHWLAPLQACDPTATRHHAAAVTIARRGLGHRARRTPGRPRRGQRTTPGTPPGQANTTRPSSGKSEPKGRPVKNRPGPEALRARQAPKTVRGAAAAQSLERTD
jgi:IS605 OrfB family transposase